VSCLLIADMQMCRFQIINVRISDVQILDNAHPICFVFL